MSCWPYIRSEETHRVDNIEVTFVCSLRHQNLLAEEISFVGGPLLLVRVAVPVERVAVGLRGSDRSRRRGHRVIVDYVLLIVPLGLDDIVRGRAVA